MFLKRGMHTKKRVVFLRLFRTSKYTKLSLQAIKIQKNYTINCIYAHNYAPNYDLNRRDNLY